MIDNETDQIINDLGRAIADFAKGRMEGLGSITISMQVDGRCYNATVGVTTPCPHCGDEVYSNVSYCPFCGAEIEEAEE